MLAGKICKHLYFMHHFEKIAGVKSSVFSVQCSLLTIDD